MGQIGAKTYSALVILTAISRPMGFTPKMVSATANALLGKWHDGIFPSGRTRTRVFKELLDNGLLRKEGYTYYPSEKLRRYSHATTNEN